MRRPFYSVEPTAYLFATKQAAHGGVNEREEPVRQWCAFELMRAYGVNISDLSFEEKVRVGSKIYRIDILVRRNDLPWIVVECKEPKHTKHEEGIDQAISYAGAEKILAEYAVYTNGTAWQVRRRVDGEWNTVSDIPVTGPARPRGSIDELLITVERVSPLLHKLDEPLEGKDARIYLEALQRFFLGTNLITASVDHDLRCATDNLLRVLSTGPDDEEYSRGKLSNAVRFAEGFRLKTGLDSALPEIHSEEHVCSFMNSVSGCMHSWVEAGRGLQGVNESLVRLFLSLLSYGARQAGRSYPLFPAHLHAALRDFLTKAMALSMDVQVPEALDGEFTSDMRHFTSASWTRLVQDDVKDHKEAAHAGRISAGAPSEPRAQRPEILASSDR